MTFPFCRKHILFYRKLVSAVVALCFSLFTVVSPAGSQAIPISGMGIASSAAFQPPVLRGMSVHPENPLLFDFLVDRGEEKIGNDLLRDESTKLIKYFLTSMTIPDKDAWVNLSPTEKDRIIPDALGQTQMGKVMLEQDYVLKQLASSLTNPDTELGKEFWAKLGNSRDRSLQNKVWIVPAGATVVEKDGFAYIMESKLTVMLDEDYQAVGAYCNTPLQKNTDSSAVSISTAVFREMILPKLIEEVNTGKNFAATRQVYQSVILAAWYKKALKDSLLGRIYADKSKIAGVETDEKDIKQKVYEQYLEAFKKGAYNVIKEEAGPDGELIPRKYFSGGQIMASRPTVVSSPAAVEAVAGAINSAGNQLALVAASTVEMPDEAQAVEASSSGLEQEALAPHMIARFQADAPQLDWKNASKVLWSELVRDENAQPRPESEKQQNYFQNQTQARAAVLDLIFEYSQGKVLDYDALLNRLKGIHQISLLGVSGKRPYDGNQYPDIDDWEAQDQAGNVINYSKAQELVGFINDRMKGFVNKDFQKKSAKEKAEYIARFYVQLASLPNIFGRVNHSLYMIWINAMLRLSGFDGVRHGWWDISWRLGEETAASGQKEMFERIVDANSLIDFGASLPASSVFESSLASSQLETPQGYWESIPQQTAGVLLGGEENIQAVLAANVGKFSQDGNFYDLKAILSGSPELRTFFGSVQEAVADVLGDSQSFNEQRHLTAGQQTYPATQTAAYVNETFIHTTLVSNVVSDW